MRGRERVSGSIMLVRGLSHPFIGSFNFKTDKVQVLVPVVLMPSEGNF